MVVGDDVIIVSPPPPHTADAPTPLFRYREAKAEGAVWLWKRAIARAGGGRAITTFIFRLWANHVKSEHSRAKKILRIVIRMQGRKTMVPFAGWVRYVAIMKSERKESSLREQVRVVGFRKQYLSLS